MISAVFCEVWNYADQTSWPNVCSSGQSQSPINIVKSQTQLTDFKPLIWRNNATALGTGIGSCGVREGGVRVVFSGMDSKCLKMNHISFFLFPFIGIFQKPLRYILLFSYGDK